MTKQWRPQFGSDDLEILAEKRSYVGFSEIKQFELHFPLFQGGMSHPVHRELIIRPSAAGVVLVDLSHQKVVLIEQFRIGALSHTKSPWLLELATGVIDAGETPEDAARREVFEETGCELKALVPICSYLTTPGIASEKIYLYCGLIEAPLTDGNICGLEEEGENIRVWTFSFQEAFDLLKNGQIVSSPAVIGLLWLQLNQAALPFPL